MPVERFSANGELCLNCLCQPRGQAHIDYKGTRIKQYHKEGQALRTETTINNSRDFYVGKSLHNLPALRQIGLQANRRVLEVQSIPHDSILAEETLQQLQRPRIVEGQRVSALRFADPTVQALCNALLVLDLLPAGFSNRELRTHFAQLLGQPVETLTQGRRSYHLRPLRLKSPPAPLAAPQAKSLEWRQI